MNYIEPIFNEIHDLIKYSSYAPCHNETCCWFKTFKYREKYVNVALWEDKYVPEIRYYTICLDADCFEDDEGNRYKDLGVTSEKFSVMRKSWEKEKVLDDMCIKFIKEILPQFFIDVRINVYNQDVEDLLNTL